VTSAVAIAAAVACLVAAAAPALAAAQDHRPAPSPHELWKTYPLQRTPEPGVSPAGSRVRATTTKGAPPSSRGGTPIAPLAGIVLPLVAVLMFTLRRRRRVRPAAEKPASTGVVLKPRRQPRLLAAGSGRLAFDGPPEPRGRTHHRMSRGRGNPSPADAPPPARVESPDPARAWTAQVEWEHAQGSGRFRVVANDERDGTTAVVAESEPMEWPPSGQGAVRAMADAADALEAGLLSAGWEALEPGEAWYAKRFAWKPVVEERTRRFERDATWQCVLRWRTADDGSRYEAVMLAPGTQDGKVVQSRLTSTLLLHGRVERLTESLVEAGWERVPGDDEDEPAEAGAPWFSRRFVWLGESPPPERIETRRGEAAT
jgi:hypothetical protein